jgi:hypothetical protein
MLPEKACVGNVSGPKRKHHDFEEYSFYSESQRPASRKRGVPALTDHEGTLGCHTSRSTLVAMNELTDTDNARGIALAHPTYPAGDHFQED